jgi:hypothetical protein
MFSSSQSSKKSFETLYERSISALVLVIGKREHDPPRALRPMRGE